MSEEYLPRRRKELDSLNAFNPFSYFTTQAPPVKKEVSWLDSVAAKQSVLPRPQQSWMEMGTSFMRQRPTNTATTFFSSIFSYFFYLSIITFFIFMILTVVHYTLTPIFKFDSSGSAPLDLSKGTADGQLTWSSGPPSSDSSPTPPFKNLLNSDYTLSFDVFISSDFSTIRSPHVILYRSRSPKKLTATMDISQILTSFDDSNLIVYVDSMKNDLYILTQTTTTNGQVTPEPLPVITNVPIGSPFRIGIIFTTNYVEVYINGKLEATRVLKGTLIGSIGSFYSSPSMVSSRVKIGNLQYWSRILTPSDLRSAGPVLPPASFFTK